LLDKALADLKSEFQRFKKNMDKGFTSLEKNLSEMILFQKCTTKLVDFISKVGFFIVGALIACAFIHMY
jgi:hypothetical protein